MNYSPGETRASEADVRTGCASTDLPLGRILTMKLRDTANSFLDAEGGCHGVDHSNRVHASALVIGREMGARLDVLRAAAMLQSACSPRRAGAWPMRGTSTW